MLVGSQICAALAQHRNLSCSNEATKYVCNSIILVGSNGGYDLRPQEHPFVDKHLRLDHFQSFDCGIVHLLQLVGNVVFPVFRLLTVSVSVRSFFLYDVVGN